MKDDEGCTALIKVAIGKHFWYKMDRNYPRLVFVAVMKHWPKPSQERKGLFGLQFYITVSDEGKPGQEFNQDLRQEMKQRSWGNDAFPWLFPRLAQISYTTEDNLPSHTTTPRKLCPPRSTSIKEILYMLPRVQSGGGNSSSDIPSFQVSSTCVKLSKQANEQATSPTTTVVKQC